MSIATGINLVKRGWATTFGTGISTNDYYTTCNTPFTQKSGIAVLYMPVNSIGKLCLRYFNPNNILEPIHTPTIFQASNLFQSATNITIWNYSGINTIPKNTTTIAYWIRTGNQSGFYGITFPSCIATPFAVGYNNDSNILQKDFPFLGALVSCPARPFPEIDSIEGIGVKYIPYS